MTEWVAISSRLSPNYLNGLIRYISGSYLWLIATEVLFSSFRYWKFNNIMGWEYAVIQEWSKMKMGKSCCLLKLNFVRTLQNIWQRDTYKCRANTMWECSLPKRTFKFHTCHVKERYSEKKVCFHSRMHKVTVDSSFRALSQQCESSSMWFKWL